MYLFHGDSSFSQKIKFLLIVDLNSNDLILLQDMMRGSMAKARVLYATVEEVGNEDRLLRACRILII